MTIDWRTYQSAGFHDELVLPDGRARTGAGKLVGALAKLSDEELLERKTAADLAIRSMGITFSVYQEGTNIDREWPDRKSVV